LIDSIITESRKIELITGLKVQEARNRRARIASIEDLDYPVNTVEEDI
jgi:hypothetical protein